jgi:hypothetical protein
MKQSKSHGSNALRILRGSKPLKGEILQTKCGMRGKKMWLETQKLEQV